MVNDVKLSGTVVDESYYEIKRSKDNAVLGHKVRIRFGTGTSMGYVTVNHWNPQSPLQTATAGAELTVEGSLDFDSWEKDGQRRSQITIRAGEISI